MELLIVMLVVGASAVFLARRFWKAFSSSAETGCSDGCAGCACSSGHGSPLQADKDSCQMNCQKQSTDSSQKNDRRYGGSKI